MCCSYVYASMWLLDSCKKFTLTGWVLLATVWLVSRLVAPPLVESGSKWSCNFSSICAILCLKVSPCRSFCSQKPSQRHGVGPLPAAPNKDHTKGRTVAPNSQTSCVLCTSGKLKGLFFFAPYAFSMWFGAGPTRNQTSRGDGLVDVPKNALTWSAPSPKHSAIVPMFPFSSAWWPSDEWTFAMEFVTDNWVIVLS